MTLLEASKSRDNNLNLMRIIAAIMVIFSHSWPISYGADHSDFLNIFSKGQITFGNVSVCLFFFLGGFLIMSSAERSKTARIFFKKRVQRLFPSLIAVVVCTVFILGPFFTKLDLASYFTNTDTYKYLLNAVLLPVHSLPGVFTNNIYGTTVNGPLWTMPVEFACYVICFFMYAIHMTDQKKMKYTIILFIPLYFLVLYLLRNYSVLQAALRPMGLFYMGMLFYVYREKIVLKGWLAFTAGTILIVSLLTNTLEYVILFTFSYVTAYLGFVVKKNYHFLDGKPDLSYQIYLCAWPIQQIITQINGGSMNNILNFIESLPLTIIAAAILYEVIDHKSISLLKSKG